MLCYRLKALLLFMFSVYHAFVFVHCNLVVTLWLLLGSLVYDGSCVFVTFPCDVLGQVWYLIVSIPDLCLLYFVRVIDMNTRGGGGP